MKTRTGMPTDQSGGVFLMSLVFATIFSIIAAGTVKLISYGSEAHGRDVETIRSYWANEAAMQVAYRYLSRLNPLTDINTTVTFTQSYGNLAASTVNGSLPGGR